jgi:prepilin-type N-terminal cleavage/methylation domain-containing protein
MKKINKNKNGGFSLVEMLVAMSITLLLLGLVASLFARALSVRARESRRTDALTSAQAALNVMSREISNAGYGMNYVNATGNKLPSNGLKVSDSTNRQIHFRANTDNNVNTSPGTTSAGEDVTYFFDAATASIVRYDANLPAGSRTSVVVNRISQVTFTYFDYVGATSTGTATAIPTRDTGRIEINITVTLDPVQGQPNGQVSFTSQVTLRNSNYMLNQY